MTDEAKNEEQEEAKEVDQLKQVVDFWTDRIKVADIIANDSCGDSTCTTDGVLAAMVAFESVNRLCTTLGAGQQRAAAALAGKIQSANGLQVPPLPQGRRRK